MTEMTTLEVTPVPFRSGPLARVAVWLEAHGVTPERREFANRLVLATMSTLLLVGLVSKEASLIWTQFGLATVALLFALIFATSPWRAAGYTFALTLFGVLKYYSIATGVDWALALSNFVQVFGVATATAKSVQPVPVDVTSTAVVRPAVE